ncbi:hypothetical protein KP509_18G000100 [Ceratopteris richardii]|nr:hypothetical protein KP509_18G000100 [Ceratopteris richardii]
MLRECGRGKDIEKGSQIHDEIVKKGLLEKCADAISIMYAKCGDLSKAKELLDSHKSHNLVAWTALISGYIKQGQGEMALQCSETMQGLGLSPDSVTYSSILKACANLRALGKGEKIHDDIARQGLLQNDVILATALVDMYVKCGEMAKAQQVLNELSVFDVVIYNAILTGYAKQGQAEQVLECYERMCHDGTRPNGITFSNILKACAILGDIGKGEQIHKEIVRLGLPQNDLVLGTSLLDMYAKCGALPQARRVLEQLPARDVVAWSSIIAGYAQKGLGEQALKCFKQMEDEGVSPDAVTYTCILKACGSIGAIKKGKEIHDRIESHRMLQDNTILGSALVDMYAKCGDLVRAQGVLEGLPVQDEVCFNALISGCVQQDQGEQAFKWYDVMQAKGLSPNAVTFSSLLKACSSMGSVENGVKIHDEIEKEGLLAKNIVLGTALVDMYAKCGALVKAREALDGLPFQSTVVWNALMTGYSQQGQGKEVLACFKQLQRAGHSPDAVTLSCVLNACSHLGLVEEGYMHFVSMTKKFGIEPDIEHWTCVIDLFGRAGHLDKAAELIQEMPPSNDPMVWSVLLGACRKWGNVDVAKWAFEQATANCNDSAPYVLMADIYVAAGKERDAQVIEELRRSIEKKKIIAVHTA